MSQTTPPKIRRTRRHVVLRLTPSEAAAAAIMVADSSAPLPPILSRCRKRVMAAMAAARDAGKIDPAPKPNRTSIGQPAGRQLRKGDTI